MSEDAVLVIGAGAAGLAAAESLSAAGIPVQVLEARARPGERIWTVPGPVRGLAVELGAEFIHGKKNLVWDVVREARLRTCEVADQHWRFREGKLEKDGNFWEELSAALQRINPDAPDQDLQSFLDQAWSLTPETRLLVTEYVEGFHAAPRSRASVHALARAEAVAERDQGTRAFHITGGYQGVVQWFARRLEGRGVQPVLSCAVRLLKWAPGHVEARVETPEGARTYAGRFALITVPLGVLQAGGPAGLVFEPSLGAKQDAIAGLGMGTVVKVALLFRERFWPERNFGFVHTRESLLPTWWSDPRAPLVTGWAGGPAAQRLRGWDKQALVEEAGLKTLASIFRADLATLRGLLVDGWTHDWNQDPLAGGAYSYTPVRAAGLARQLAEPVDGTLFFAGEATDSEGEQGTVQAALASGRRAADEVMNSIGRGSKSGGKPNFAGTAHNIDGTLSTALR